VTTLTAIQQGREKVVAHIEVEHGGARAYQAAQVVDGVVPEEDLLGLGDGGKGVG
jgi:hypothetical protein